jgi:hypothetical protein
LHAHADVRGVEELHDDRRHGRSERHLAWENVTLSGNSVVVLSGGPNDTFVVNVTGKFKLTDSAKIVASGVPRSAVIYNVISSGQQVVLSSRSPGGASCCSASLDGTLLAVDRAISLGPGLIKRRGDQRAEYQPRRWLQRAVRDGNVSLA